MNKESATAGNSLWIPIHGAIVDVHHLLYSTCAHY